MGVWASEIASGLPDIAPGTAREILTADGTGSPVWGHDFVSQEADGPAAAAWSFNTATSYSVAGAKLLQVMNNGVERASIDYSGTLSLKTVGGGGTTISPSGVFTTTNGYFNFSTSKVWIGLTHGDVLGIKSTTISFPRDEACTITRQPHISDAATARIEYIGQSAYSAATTNIVGGSLVFSAGNGASGSAGAAHGGDIDISAGNGYGTGRGGYVRHNPTSGGGTVEFKSHCSDSEYSNGNSGASATIDWRRKNHQSITLTNSTPAIILVAPPGPSVLVLRMAQDGGGSNNPTWPAAVKWSGGVEPAWSTATGAIDIVQFYYDGTSYHGWLASKGSA